MMIDVVESNYLKATHIRGKVELKSCYSIIQTCFF
jgi:hypothetical protein